MLRLIIVVIQAIIIRNVLVTIAAYEFKSYRMLLCTAEFNSAGGRSCFERYPKLFLESFPTGQFDESSISMMIIIRGAYQRASDIKNWNIGPTKIVVLYNTP